MADLGMDNTQKQINEFQDKATDVMHGVRDRFGNAYNAATDWMEDNSITLFAIGGGILVAGLLTYFIARRKGTEFQASVEKAA